MIDESEMDVVEEIEITLNFKRLVKDSQFNESNDKGEFLDRFVMELETDSGPITEEFHGYITDKFGAKVTDSINKSDIALCELIRTIDE